MTSNMTVRLDELPPEILQNIVVYITDNSSRTAVSLKSVNRCLSEAVDVVRNRRRTIKFDKNWKISQPAKYDPSKFETTHYLTIETAAHSGSESLDPSDIVSLIPRIKNLKSLTWNAGPVATVVLEALEKHHPACTLQVFRWWRPDDALHRHRLSDSEIALTKFSGLTHFKYPAHGSPSRASAAFQQIVARSPNLIFASFTNNNAFWPVENPTLLEEAATQDGEEGQAPTKLRSTTLKSLTIDCADTEVSPRLLEHFARFIDLSLLETVKFSRGTFPADYFRQAATLLPNLKHVFLNLTWSNQDIVDSAADYLRECTPLRTLSLWGWNRVISLEDLIKRHQASLEVLQLHEKTEQYAIHTEIPMLGVQELELLQTSCRQLKDLTIDMNAPTIDLDLDKESETILRLKALASFGTGLRKLTLYLDGWQLYDWMRNREAFQEFDAVQVSAYDAVRSADKEWVEFQEQNVVPYVESYVKNIWKIVYGESATGERLLDVKFGNTEAKILPVGSASLRYICTIKPHERDDMVGESVVSTKILDKYF